MSFNITPVSAATAPPSAARTAPARPIQDAGSDAVMVDTIPSGPPPEVHDAIAVAGQAYAQLAATDRQLHFNVDARTGQVSIEVHDLRGNVLFTVPSSKALDIAAGGAL
jgi:hypothetical protein